MNLPNYFKTPQGRKIAYHQINGEGIGVVFLGGFNSDMTGTKAVFLEEWALKNNRPFLRFDYSGHGESSEEVGGLLFYCVEKYQKKSVD